MDLEIKMPIEKINLKEGDSLFIEGQEYLIVKSVRFRKPYYHIRIYRGVTLIPEDPPK